jgi:hypothetical protein
MREFTMVMESVNLLRVTVKLSHSLERVTFSTFTGVRLEYLPPYSPDLNPIEEAFSKIKAFIRRNCDVFLASPQAGIMYDMLEAMSIITGEDAEGYFIHAGYY